MSEEFERKIMEFFNAFLFKLVIIVAIMMVLVMFLKFYRHAYRDGQIDCLNGKIYYELQKQEDGTTQWIYAEEK